MTSYLLSLHDVNNPTVRNKQEQLGEKDAKKEQGPDTDPSSSVWIKGSGSVSKCHGSGTLINSINNIGGSA